MVARNRVLKPADNVLSDPLLIETIKNLIGGTPTSVAHTHVMGDITAAGSYRFGVGAAGTPSVAIGEADDGFYAVAANNLAATINGSKVFDWDADSIQFIDGYRLRLGATGDIVNPSDDVIAALDSVNDSLRISIQNESAGASAEANFTTVNDEDRYVSVGVKSTGHSSSGTDPRVAGEGYLDMSSDLFAGTARPLFILNRLNSYLRFGTNNLERARILSTGQMLVGLTSQTYSEMLGVNGRGYFNGEVMCTKLGVGLSAAPTKFIEIKADVTDTQPAEIGVVLTDNGSRVGALGYGGGGDMFVGTTSDDIFHIVQNNLPKISLATNGDIQFWDDAFGDKVVFTVDSSANLTINPDGDKVVISDDLEIDGDFDHDGSNVGFFGVAPAARASAYTATNVAEDRAYDADSTSVEELADVLGTLIADLKLYGLLQ